jgi:hypothetical protein
MTVWSSGNTGGPCSRGTIRTSAGTLAILLRKIPPIRPRPFLQVCHDYVNITIAIMDIFHVVPFNQKNILDTVFSLRLKVEPTQLGPIGRASFLRSGRWIMSRIMTVTQLFLSKFLQFTVDLPTLSLDAQ